MGARNGTSYLEGLRDEREVWLGDDRVKDVTEHPQLAGGAAGMAAYFDHQHRFADDCLIDAASFASAPDGPTNASHLIPRSPGDLAVRHRALRRLASYSVGMLGRTPDYLNVTVAGFAGRADVWSRNGNDEGAANLVAFHAEVARRDLSLTHTIVHPTVDKRVADIEAGDGEVALRKVADTDHGIVVRGARVLATLAPFADEIFVYPGQPIAREASAHALAFSIPLATPGLRVLCRDSYALAGDRFDHPFSSRFDEQDAFVIFDDVEVPRARVFLDGDTEIHNKVMASGWAANVMQQTVIRACVKLEFAHELASRMAEAIGDDSAATEALLGEIWSYGELARAALHTAEDRAYEWGNGTWFCDEAPFRAMRPTLPVWLPRVNEIIKLIGSHNLLATPTRAQLDDPLLRPLIDRFFQGADGWAAEERIALFRLAWDFVGTGLAGRTELYERFYLASSTRTFQMAQRAAQRDLSFELLDGVLDALPGGVPDAGDRRPG